MLTRFEGEVENKILLPTFISMLDGKFLKLTGFPALLKVICALEPITPL